MANLQKVLLFGDLHAPYESKPALRLLLKVLKAVKPDHLVNLGDFCDCAAVSFHSKDPSRAQDLAWEMDHANSILDALDGVKIPGRKIWLDGNHDFRLTRYIADKAPELFGLISLPKILRLKERGWEYHPYRKHTKLGKLLVCHDIGRMGRYAVHRNLDALQHSVVTGHTHRFSLVVEGNALGENRVAASFGWLGSLDDIDYASRLTIQKDWQHGIGLAYLEPTTGYVTIAPIPFLPAGKGFSCVVEGQRYTS